MALTAENRLVDLALLGAAVLLVAGSLLMNDLSRYLEWDEAVYFAEVSARAGPIGFDAHRARGASWLALPVALAGGGVVALRAYLLAAFGLGLFLSFRSWAKSVGAFAAIAGLMVFGTNWLSLFYSVELSPNLFVALISVGLTGTVVAGPTRSPPTAASASIVFLLTAMLALLRPLDAAIVGMAIAWLRRHEKADVAAVLSGLAVGAVVWVAEAAVRFDGVWARIRQAADLTESTGSLSLLDHVRLLDGGLVGPGRDLSIPWLGVIWVAVFAALVVVGSRSHRDEVKVALVPGLLLVGTYTLFVGALAPRFLLPAYGLLAVPAGAGLRETWLAVKRRSVPAKAGATALAAVLVMTVGWHLRTAARIADLEHERRTGPQRLGEELDEAADGSCAFASEYGYPQIAFASGCAGKRIDVGDPGSVQSWLARHRRSGDRVFVVVLHDPPGSAFFESWPAEVVRINGVSWTVYGPSDNG